MKIGDKMITLKIILIITTIYIDIKLNQNKYVTNFTYLDIISILLNIVLDIILIKGEINIILYFITTLIIILFKYIYEKLYNNSYIIKYNNETINDLNFNFKRVKELLKSYKL